jgi:hypothetical protein
MYGSSLSGVVGACGFAFGEFEVTVVEILSFLLGAAATTHTRWVSDCSLEQEELFQADLAATETAQTASGDLVVVE